MRLAGSSAARRLVEQQQPGCADQAGSEVEPAALAAGIGAAATVGDLAQTQLLDHDARGALAAFGVWPKKRAVMTRFSRPVRVGLDRGVLTGETDAAANGERVADDVDAADVQAPTGRGDAVWRWCGRRWSCPRRSVPRMASTSPVGATRSSPASAVTFPKRTVRSRRFEQRRRAHRASPSPAGPPAAFRRPSLWARRTSPRWLRQERQRARPPPVHVHLAAAHLTGEDDPAPGRRARPGAVLHPTVARSGADRASSM